MESSSYTNYANVDEYPYPTNLSAESFISVKLSGLDKYRAWVTQMLCLFESHGMLGFIDGTFNKPDNDIEGGDHRYRMWRRSDAVVRGWILGSLSEGTLVNVLECLKDEGAAGEDFCAIDLWRELISVYDSRPVYNGDLLEYPYPSNFSTESFITVKLSGTDKYGVWETQMRCLLDSHGMLGFINEASAVSRKYRFGGDDSFGTWSRSDAVVRGWILGSLSEEILIYVLKRLKEKNHNYFLGHNKEFCAVDLWLELRKIYMPPRPRLEFSPYELKRRPIPVNWQSLYDATVAENWDDINRILRANGFHVTDIIPQNGNTTLHVVVSTTMKPKLLKKMLKLTEDTLLDLKNSDGSTVLHVAAIVGNIEAARILVERSPNLLLATDDQKQTPLAIALINMDTKMSDFLLKSMNNNSEIKERLSEGSGDELLVNLISSKSFGLANDLLKNYKKLNDDAVLIAMAQNFPNELNKLERCLVLYVEGTGEIGSRVKKVLDSVQDDMLNTCVPLCGSWVETIFWLFFLGIYGITMFFPLIPQMLVWPFIKKRVQIHGDAMKLLPEVCRRTSNLKDYYKSPLIEAAKQNANEVVQGILNNYVHASLLTSQDGHDFIQIAVINRSEKVYNLVYNMGEQKNIYQTIKDVYDNNLLHLAGKLAPSSKLDLITGAFLQIQHELQWFEEVKGFASPLSVKQENFSGETPQMVFTREHRSLVIEGEKWLKATAESYTIAAALITTIVFAAAITVPGGNNQDTGIPMFTNNSAFTVFAISDGISLLAAVTSLLVFLSILTTRYAEQDFLFKLPTKLIIGLVTLFISTTAMLVASGATLYLVFGQRNSKILISIIVFTCLPIVVFVTLQTRLVIDLMIATYGRSIFGKKSNHPIYIRRKLWS